MKMIKKIWMFGMILLISISLFNFNSIKVHAENDDKLTAFISSCFESGYITMDLNITKTNEKDVYNLEFYYKENLLGMDYGFYLYPNVIENLNTASIIYDSKVENQYGIIQFKYSVDNLSEFLSQLSILPFIDFQFVTEKGTNDSILNVKIQEDFFKEEKEKNPLVKDIINTNVYTVKLDRVNPNLTSHNAPLIDNKGNAIWTYSSTIPQPEFSAIINEDPKILSMLKIFKWSNLGMIAIIVSLIIFAIILCNKFYFSNLKKDKSYDNQDYNYNNNMWDNSYDNQRNDYYNNYNQNNNSYDNQDNDYYDNQDNDYYDNYNYNEHDDK